MRVGRAPSLWLVALLGLVSSCAGEEKLTALVVAVDSDIDDLDAIEVDVSHFGMQPLVGAEITDNEPLPRTLGLVHRGGPLGPITITVKGIRGGATTVVERRARVYFVKDRVMMLRINLWNRCIDYPCSGEGRTCDVVRDEVMCRDEEVKASELTEWTGEVPPLMVPVDMGPDAGEDGGSMLPDEDAAMGADAAMGVDAATGVDAAIDAGVMDAGADATTVDDAGTDAGGVAVDAGVDAAVDAGVIGTCGAPAGCDFSFVPSNFDPAANQLRPGLRVAPMLDCDVTFDSDDLTPADWCGTVVTPFSSSQGGGGGDVTVVPLSGLLVTAASTLTLTGSRPVILAVFGDATIAGHIDASAVGAQPGAGGNGACGSRGAAGGGGGGVPGGGGGGGGAPPPPPPTVARGATISRAWTCRVALAVRRAAAPT